MAQLHNDHSSDNSQEQMTDSEATYTDPTLMIRQDNPASLSSLSNLIPSIQQNAPQYDVTRYNGMALNESFIIPADHDLLQRLNVKTRRWKRLASSPPSTPFPATLALFQRCR